MKIFVRNLNLETTEPQLRESFEEFGEVSSMNIVKDPDSGKLKGFAYVEMSSDEHARQAITGLHGRDLAGNRLKVKEAIKR
jgi:RNA recognition motif-containing protein